MSGLELMLPPFVACMILVAIHSYLGLHVIAREVIFVDLSLAQMAALGTTTGLLVGVNPGSTTAQLFAFGFGFGGPAFFWTWPLVFVGQMAVALCFAEMSGQFPLAGSVGVQTAIAGVLIRSDYKAIAKPELVQTLQQHRLRSSNGADLIDVLIRRLQAQ